MMLDAAERRRVLVAWNDTRQDYPHGACIHELFEGQAARTPQAAALIAGKRQLSYGELNAQANRVAHELRSLGVKPDERVGICAERSAEMVIGLLGILKAGGAYVPLDPVYPSARLRWLLDDSEARILLTHSHLRARFAARPALHILEFESSAWRSRPASNLQRAETGLSSEHLAYLIYTSGSTGLPKGVMVEHRNLTALYTSYITTCAMSTADRMLQFASFSFDASVGELFPALAAGATL